MGKQAFHGTLQGNGPEVSRCGSKNNGIVVKVHGWDGGLRITMWRDKHEDCDWVHISCGPHGNETARSLYSGPIGELHREGLLVKAAQAALARECA